MAWTQIRPRNKPTFTFHYFLKPVVNNKEVPGALSPLTVSFIMRLQTWSRIPQQNRRWYVVVIALINIELVMSNGHHNMEILAREH